MVKLGMFDFGHCFIVISRVGPYRLRIIYTSAYLCGHSYCQSIMAVYITDVKVAMLMNKNKKN